MTLNGHYALLYTKYKSFEARHKDLKKNQIILSKM